MITITLVRLLKEISFMLFKPVTYLTFQTAAHGVSMRLLLFCHPFSLLQLYVSLDHCELLLTGLPNGLPVECKCYEVTAQDQC
jgi:hypothetical protein